MKVRDCQLPRFFFSLTLQYFRKRMAWYINWKEDAYNTPTYERDGRGEERKKKKKIELVSTFLLGS